MMIKSQAPEDVAAQWVSAFNGADLSSLRALCRDDVVVHAASPGDGSPPGLERIFSLLSRYRAAFPEGQFTIESVDTHNGITCCRWTARGTHQGPFLHVPPTNRDVTVRGTCRFACRDGRIAEHWFDFSAYDIFSQLGALLPEPGQASALSQSVSDAAMTTWVDALHGRRLAFDQAFSDDVVVHAVCFGLSSTARGHAALHALWGTIFASASEIEVSVDDCLRQGVTSTYRGRLSARLPQHDEPTMHRLYCMFATSGHKVREFWTRIERRTV